MSLYRHYIILRSTAIFNPPPKKRKAHPISVKIVSAITANPRLLVFHYLIIAAQRLTSTLSSQPEPERHYDAMRA